MRDELPDFMGGDLTGEEVVPVVESPETPVVETPAPEPVIETPAPVVEQPAPPPPVPLATYLDTRDKLTALEKEAKELREWRRQQEEQANRRPMPDRETEPAAYEAAQHSMIQEQLRLQNLNTSIRLARMEYGPDVSKAALDWGYARCDQDEHFNAKVKASADPMALVVGEWRREQIASKVDPADLDGYLAWKAQQAPGAPVAPQVAPVAPRQSLASGPSAGKNADVEAMSGEQTFKGMFGEG